MPKEQKPKLLYDDIISDLSFESLPSKIDASLVHRDCTKSNIILLNNIDSILIDWDNSEISTWIADLARLTFVYPKKGLKKKILRQKDFEYSLENIKIIERIEHIRNALEGLLYPISVSDECYYYEVLDI